MIATKGAAGTELPLLTLGCDRLGSIMTPLDRRQCVALVKEAFELGIRGFDTASTYGQGDSERYIGEALMSVRDKVLLATKAGQMLTPRQRAAARMKGPIRLMLRLRGKFREKVRAERAAGLAVCFEPSYIESSLEASLRRLRTERVEIFYLHSPPGDVLQIDELFAMLERQRRFGKIGAVGVSCDTLETAAAAAKHPGVEVIQLSLSTDSEFRRVVDTASSSGKITLVRGLARTALARRERFEEALAEGFRTAIRLPSVGGVILGTTDKVHLRLNVEALRRVAGQVDVAH